MSSYRTFDIEADVARIDTVPQKQPTLKFFAAIATLLFATVVLVLWTNMRDSGAPREGVAITGVITYMSLDLNKKVALFENFKKRFEKKYHSEFEEIERFYHFLSSMVRIDQRNEAERRVGGTAVHGITKFSDRSKAELKHIFGYANQAEAVFERVLVDVPAYMGIEKFADWSDKYATPVRDQGYCGSCWAFSAVNQIESDAIRAGISTRENLLSVQQVTACDHHSHGCGGGTTERAYDYIMRSGGISYEQDYPYSDASHVEDDNTTSCIPSRISPKIELTGVYGVRGLEMAMMDYVLSLGPLSICIDASSWDTYVHGVVSACGKVVDHCVQIVGVDKEKMAWKVRNQWGTDWGEDGYIYLQVGENMCGLTHDPTFVTVRKIKSD